MTPPVRTVVVASDPRTLRALSRLLATEPALVLCGFAQDAHTAATIARSVGAQLLLVEAGLPGCVDPGWPADAKRVLLLGGDGVPADSDGYVHMERVSEQLNEVLDRLFP